MKPPRIASTIPDSLRVKHPDTLLSIWLEVWAFCHLNCNFCCNSGGRGGRDASHLTMGEYARLLETIHVLGVKEIGIPGYGEPLHTQNYALVQHIACFGQEHGIGVYIFTTGDLVTDDMADWLFEHGVSLMVKHNSAIPSVQDTIVQSEGYTARRNRALAMLMEKGFCKKMVDTEGNPTTRLAFVTPILPQNRTELPDILRYCRAHNIYLDVDTVLEVSRGEMCGHHGGLTDEEVRETVATLQETDRSLGYMWDGVNPTYIGASPCDRYSHHLHVNCRGEIAPCFGADKRRVIIGNVRECMGVARAWESSLMHKIRAREYCGVCTACRLFQTRQCNSCLGRYAAIHNGQIVTHGCWNKKD